MSPKILDCLSICEFAPLLATLTEDELADKLEALAGKREISRIYLGSAFCPQLFFAISPEFVSHLVKVCKKTSRKLTLVIPIFTQKNLRRGLDLTHRLIALSDGCIDELSVNDYGQCSYWTDEINKGACLKLNLGRLLNKDTRDPRNRDYTRMPYTPCILRRAWNGHNNLERLLNSFSLSGIEFDPTHTRLYLRELEAGLQAACYEPFCYISCSQICEFAGIGAASAQAFFPNRACKLQCLHTSASYLSYNGKNEQTKFFKFGRGLYFLKHTPTRVYGCEKLRLIHHPLAEVFKT